MKRALAEIAHIKACAGEAAQAVSKGDVFFNVTAKAVTYKEGVARLLSELEFSSVLKGDETVRSRVWRRWIDCTGRSLGHGMPCPY
jgi:hypothetical protein